MKKHSNKKYSLFYCFLFALMISLTVTGCKSRSYENFTTYFNTYYNAERLMKECESEFEYQSEKKRIKPKILVPLPKANELKGLDLSQPAFLSGLVVDKASRQAVNTKLDSILEKGSKILANSPKSNYVAPSLYLMAKTYFYKEEWLPSQIKCSELIDKDPIGVLSADAHLLMAENLLMQGKYDAGLTMLSRTVDVSWLNNRYDILTKAFNIEAEMALYNGDLEGAIRPYFQAIAQSDDNSAKALWQNEMASILFRMSKFDRAEKAYAKVMNYSPDLVTEYESKLYRASCLLRLGENLEANRILDRLDNDGKYEEWKDYVLTQRLIEKLSQGGEQETVRQFEFYADSLYPTSQVKASYYFERGLKDFYDENYVDARSAMEKARGSVSQISKIATKVCQFLTNWEIHQKNIANYKSDIENANQKNNSNINENTTNNDSNNINNLNNNLSENQNSNVNQVVDSTKVIANSNQNVNKNGNENSEEKSNENSNENLDSTVQVSVVLPTKTDSLNNKIAQNYFEIARYHHNIGNKDSASYYYQAAAEIAPQNMENSARFLFVYAENLRDTNAWKADSILNVIVNTQPKTVHGKEALAKLGYTNAYLVDSAQTTYNSGYDLMKFKEYNYAAEQFRKVYTNYPKNAIYAPKALYVLGFMFENELQLFDSAKYYYEILIKKYPKSIYAEELNLSVQYKSLVDSGAEIPDSLKTKEIAIYESNIKDIINAPYDTNLLAKPREKDDGFDFKDLKNPSKLLDRAKKSIKEKLQQASEAVENPENLMDKAKEKLTPDIKIPKPEDFKPKEFKEGMEENPENPNPENNSNSTTDTPPEKPTK